MTEAASVRLLLMSLIGLSALAITAAPRAEVLEASPAGFVSEHVVPLAAAPAAAYQALTGEVSAWWDGSHSYSGDAANFSLDAVAGGCFCEALPNGGSVMHMQVVYADPGVLLRMIGGLGPLQGMGVSGSMDFALEPMQQENGEPGTLLKYRYVVHGFAPGEAGVGALADPVDQVQLGQLLRLKAFIESR